MNLVSLDKEGLVLVTCGGHRWAGFFTEFVKSEQCLTQVFIFWFEMKQKMSAQLLEEINAIILGINRGCFHCTELKCSVISVGALTLKRAFFQVALWCNSIVCGNYDVLWV